MEKIDEIVTKVVAAFEQKPIASTVKGLIILWVLKEVMKWYKK